MAALIEGIGSGAVTATFNEVEHADVIMIIGANPTENHPVAATFFKQAAKRGAKLIVIDPRGQALREYATYMLQFKPASDVALLNAIMHVIVEEKLYDVQYLQAHTENFEQPEEARRRATARSWWPTPAASTPRPSARSRAPSAALNAP